MHILDFSYIIRWWFQLLLIGFFFLPLTLILFKSFYDKGYILSKVLGMGILSYSIFILGTIHALSFTQVQILIATVIVGPIFFFFFESNNFFETIKKHWKFFIFEEIIFLSALIFWSYIKTYQPDIHGLEKFMDFGFINSILRSEYFPPKDMWFTPFSINYYYFGHLQTAFLTKLSNLPSSITYNLMLSTVFAFTFSIGFSIGLNLFHQLKESTLLKTIGYGLLSACILTFGGNSHTIYIFFKEYIAENPAPFWTLPLSLSTIPNSYWYPNATRFIHNTIHEFPLYSFVVSDLHGHVLDIPYALLLIAFLLSIFISATYSLEKNERASVPLPRLLLISFLLAIMYMTNASDGLIYFLLSGLVIFYIEFLNIRNKTHTNFWDIFLKTIRSKRTLLSLPLIGIFSVLFSLPFSLFFSPFITGIGILCSPQFLINIGKLGPFLFEANHCQLSPFWQLMILYGFFLFSASSFTILLVSKKYDIKQSDIFVLLLSFLALFLIVVPEFIYLKDIYPAHYRANTMFKLVYQSFILLSISSSYSLMRISTSLRSVFKILYSCIALLLLALVFAYPYFAITSYFMNLRTYYGLDGIRYLKNLYPNDYRAIQWIGRNIKKQPVILEAQGDSYTDYGRISVNTGLPTVLGWTVHEWLWRKTYDIPSPRIDEIKQLYESDDSKITTELINKYNIQLVYVGELEKQKYPSLREEKFEKLGRIVFQDNGTKLYKINPISFQ